jgi:hypothetical protein
MISDMDEFDEIMAEFEQTMAEFDEAYAGYETAMNDVHDILGDAETDVSVGTAGGSPAAAD